MNKNKSKNKIVFAICLLIFATAVLEIDALDKYGRINILFVECNKIENHNNFACLMGINNAMLVYIITPPAILSTMIIAVIYKLSKQKGVRDE